MQQKNLAVIIVFVIIAGIFVVTFWLPPSPDEHLGPLWVIDDVGRNVTFYNFPPERIVSLSPSSTEILFALGLGEKVVGVDTYSDYPEDTENITKVGSFSNINTELVLELKPDLVLATGGVQRTVVENLEEPLHLINASIIVLYPQNVSAVLADIAMVGTITGKTDEANTLVADMEQRIQEIVDITNNTTRPSVYVEYYFNGGYRSYGSQTMINELIYKAGGINIFFDYTGIYLVTNDETIFTAQPEVIIICKGAMADSCGLTPEVIKNRAGWETLPALVNDRIYEVDAGILTRPSPRIVIAIEQLAQLFYPELFS